MAWKKFVFYSDNHGDQADPRASAAFLKFLDRWRPEIRIHGGDNWDFRPLRRKATTEEKRESLIADFEAGMDWLDKTQPTHITLGNHDIRLWDLAELGDGVLSDFARKAVYDIELRFKQLRCRSLPYDKRQGVLRIGHLNCIHGFAHGINAARRSAQTYGAVLMGHGHGIQHVSIEGIDYRVGRMCGCLCKLYMPYNRATMAALIHAHGWAYGVINDKSGNYQVWQAESIKGKWMLPTGMEELN